MSLPSNSGITLAMATFFAVAVIGVTRTLTHQPIADSQKLWNTKQLSAVLPAEHSDNELAQSLRYRTVERKGESEQLAVYTAIENGKPAAFIMEVLTPYGYSGDIRLLLGIDIDGVITGARVIEHRETPGLGDDIDHRKSDWIGAFEGQSMASLSPVEWKIKKDGGNFDSFTGATITPRAVVNAIFQTLQWYETNLEWMIK